MAAALFIPELGHLAMILALCLHWSKRWCRCSARGAVTACG